MNNDVLYPNESYKIIGACMEVHNQLGAGFLEPVYQADFICYDSILLELKALDKLTPEHESQVLNYLKATGLKLGLLINFGESELRFKRLALTRPI